MILLVGGCQVPGYQNDKKNSLLLLLSAIFLCHYLSIYGVWGVWGVTVVVTTILLCNYLDSLYFGGLCCLGSNR